MTYHSYILLRNAWPCQLQSPEDAAKENILFIIELTDFETKPFFISCLEAYTTLNQQFDISTLPQFLKHVFLYLAHTGTCVLPFKIVRKLLQTWKYEDMKVLSTTTMMSLFFCLMTFTASAMSTILKVGLVGVSNQTSCQLKKHKQSLLNRKMCYQLSKKPTNNSRHLPDA